jgi:uncharacterized protein
MPPRFLADSMVGRLATWLRVLGYDTEYAGKLEDAAIAGQAQREDRIVLTRDRELARRKNIRTLLIASEKVDEQLYEVVTACAELPEAGAARCPMCNGELALLPKGEAAGLVPLYVYQTQERFWLCRGCGHVYWQGTHWEAIQARLETITQRRTHVGRK